MSFLSVYLQRSARTNILRLPQFPSCHQQQLNVHSEYILENTIRKFVSSAQLFQVKPHSEGIRENFHHEFYKLMTYLLNWKKVPFGNYNVSSTSNTSVATFVERLLLSTICNAGLKCHPRRHAQKWQD